MLSFRSIESHLLIILTSYFHIQTWQTFNFLRPRRLWLCCQRSSLATKHPYRNFIGLHVRFEAAVLTVVYSEANFKFKLDFKVATLANPLGTKAILYVVTNE